MARLLRSYGVSRLKPPIAVNAAVTFRPLDIQLSVTLTRSRSAPPQRITRSDLQPPTAIGAPNVYRAVSTRLAPSSRLGRVPHPHPVKPAAVASAVTFGPVTIKLVRTPRSAIKQRSDLQPPAAVGDPIVYRPLAIALSAILNRLNAGLPKRAVRSKLQPPTVVGASTVFRPVSVGLARRTWAEMVRRAAHSKYNPPATLAPPPVPPTFEQLRFRTWLTRIRPPRFLSRLKPPTVIGAPVTYGPVQVELARAQRARYRTRSFQTVVQFFPVVPPPTVEQLKTRIFLTRRGPVRLTQSRLKPPAVTAAPLVFRPVSLELAPSSRLGRASHWKLKPPTVVSFPVTAEQRYISLYLAPPPKQGRRTIWDLRPPTAVIPQLVPPYLEAYDRTTGTEGLERTTGGDAYEGTTGLAGTGRGTGLEALIRDTGP